MKADSIECPNKTEVVIAFGNIIGRHNAFLWKVWSGSKRKHDFIINGDDLARDLESFWLVPNLRQDIETVEEEMGNALADHPENALSKIIEHTHLYQKVSLVVQALGQRLCSMGEKFYSMVGTRSVDCNVVRVFDEMSVRFRIEDEMFSVTFNHVNNTCFLTHESLSGSSPEEILWPRYIFSNLDIDHFITHVMAAVNTKLCRYPTISEL